MELKTTLEKFDSNLWDYHLPIPVKIAEELTEGNDKRVTCKVNNEITIHTAIMQNKSTYFILMNKPNIKKLKIKEGDTVNLKIEKDNSEYGIPMPESFRQLLYEDTEGCNYFHSLTPGKQRSLIYIVSQVKNIESQLNKGMAILDHLKGTQGKLNFKQLMQLIKSYNQRSKLK